MAARSCRNHTALIDELDPSALGNVSPRPQRRDAILTNHIGGIPGAALWWPYWNQVIVPLADRLVALGTGPPVFNRAWPNLVFGAFRVCRLRFTFRHHLTFRHGPCKPLHYRQGLIPPDPVKLWAGKFKAMLPCAAKASRFTGLYFAPTAARGAFPSS